MLECVDIFILNEIEGYEITGERGEDGICESLLQRFPGCKVMLTLGEKRLRLRRRIADAPAGNLPREGVDSTAAGDTSVGYFLSGLQNGEPMEEILRTRARRPRSRSAARARGTRSRSAKRSRQRTGEAR